MGSRKLALVAPAEKAQTDREAFEQLLPRYQALRASQVVTARVDVQRAAAVALGVAQKVNEPRRRRRFALLPRELFDMGLLAELEPAARAALHAVIVVADADARFTTAQLPPELKREALQVRGRMLRVAGYHLGDREKTGKILKAMRGHKSHFELLTDLTNLAQLYRANVDLLSKDPTHFKASDPYEAERLAELVQSALGSSTVPKQNPRDLLARAWTVLLSTYEEIAMPGRWLFKGNGGEELFPSLVSVGRRRRSCSVKARTAPKPEP